MKKMEVTLEALKIKAVSKTLKDLIERFFMHLLLNEQNSLIYNRPNHYLSWVSLNDNFLNKRNYY